MAFEWDARTGFSHHSANAAKVLGYDQQAPLTTARFLALIHPEDRAHFKAQVRGVRPDKPSYAVEFRVLRPDGQEMWFEETATAEFDPAGKCLRIKGLTVDITERKRADEHKRLLVAELDHRVKNVLARVGVVAMYTRQGSSTIDEFVQALDQRIQSMAVAHASLSRSIGRAFASRTPCATNWLPMRRRQIRRRAGPTSRSPPRRLRRWRWCCTNS